MADAKEKKGRVSESEDAGTANARADAVSREKAEDDFGKKNTWIRNRAGTSNPESKVSPLIKVYPRNKLHDHPNSKKMDD